MQHIALLGDSIFDNAGYVDEGDSVISQLTEKLPTNTTATLLAVDGDITDDISQQLRKLPAQTTHVFISCGGNDALRIASVLNEPIASVGEAMEVFTEIRADFNHRYANMLSEVKTKCKQIALCTIYDSVPDYNPNALTALSLFNDVILREGFKIRAPIIDLRLVCNEARDYSPVSPIEPSKYGAKKITDCIVKVIEEDTFERDKTRVYF